MDLWHRDILRNLDERTKGNEKSIKKLEDTTQEILAQVTPNGGKSLKDSALRTEVLLKEIAEKLENSERLTWELSGKIAFKTDATGNAINVSQKLLSMLGIGEEDFMQWRWANLIAPRENLRVRADIKEHIDKCMNYEDNVTFLRKTDNAFVHVKLTLKTIRNAERDVIYFVGELQQL